ncbi:hypothetical protein ANANG_G00112960 [Anguilla anguilla]|uniref:BTB domain-containing protein n=1 Tax=Anguilla anguilla TaxID=7936 RepID=A0A9D3RZJ7_ANGAN|nr:hypothetical protein ANANG_G00112960 [Anguilla anguilla]
MWRWKRPGFEQTLLGELQRQQRRSLFCDTLLQAEGISVPAHSCVLAALSPALAQVLCSGPAPPLGGAGCWSCRPWGRSLCSGCCTVRGKVGRMRSRGMKGRARQRDRRISIKIRLRRQSSGELWEIVSVREEGAVSTPRGGHSSSRGWGLRHRQNQPTLSRLARSKDGLPEVKRPSGLSVGSALPQRICRGLSLTPPSTMTSPPTHTHLPPPHRPLPLQHIHPAHNPVPLPPAPPIPEDSDEQIEKLLDDIMMGLNILPPIVVETDAGGHGDSRILEPSPGAFGTGASGPCPYQCPQITESPRPKNRLMCSRTQDGPFPTNRQSRYISSHETTYPRVPQQASDELHILDRFLFSRENHADGAWERSALGHSDGGGAVTSGDLGSLTQPGAGTDKVRKSDVCADQAGGALPVKQQEVCLQRVRPTLSTLSCTLGPEGPPKRGRGRPPKKRKLDEETTGPVSILAPGGSVGQVGEHGHKSQRKWRRVIIPSSQTPSMRTPKSRACWEDEPGTPLAVAQLSSIYGEEEREGARGKKEAELIDVPTGTELIDVPTGTELIDVPTGTELIDVPTGTELIDVPTGTELIDVPTGTELMDVVMGTELIDVPMGTELIDVPTGTELIDVVMGDSTAILERVTHAERRELDGVRVGGGVENSVIRQMGPTEGGTGQEQRGSDGEGADPAGGETERRRTEEEGPGQSQPGSERRDGVTLNLSDPCWAVRERSTGSWELDEEEVEVDVMECSSPAPPPIDLLLETTGVELCDREPSEEEEGEVDVIGETD